MSHQLNSDDPEAIKNTLCVMGDKWSALILRLLHSGPKRFKDFEHSLDNISPRTLSQRLDKLQISGVIAKKVCPKSPGYFEYEITKKGLALDPVIHEMATWGERYPLPN